MTEFYVGDRVVITDSYECNNEGLEAIIVDIGSRGYTKYLLEFEPDQIEILVEREGNNPLHNGNNRDGHQENNRWYVPEKCIELLDTLSGSPYGNVIRKIKAMEKKRQELGYRW